MYNAPDMLDKRKMYHYILLYPTVLVPTCLCQQIPLKIKVGRMNAEDGVWLKVEPRDDAT